MQSTFIFSRALQKRVLTLGLFSLILPLSLFSQLATIRGKIVEEQTDNPMVGVEVKTLSASVFTDFEGQFELQLSANSAEVVLTLVKGGYQTLEIPVRIDGRANVSIGTKRLRSEENLGQIAGEEIIPTITLSTDDQNSAGAQSISGILTASRDRFVNTIGSVFGPYRFNFRGYRSEHTMMFLNNIPVNDPENGGVFWSKWGGLNDVLRNRTIEVGLGSNAYSVGSVGGATAIDTRASTQRQQTRISYALSNRSYDHRAMATHSTGLLPGGWAMTVSASRRWAQEGFQDGTFYDAYSYFLSVDKKLGDNHLLNITAFGSPNKRGRSGAATQELYDLAGTNYYNSYWGYQEGEKRNSRVSDTHQPMAILRHDWTIGDNTTLTTSLAYQGGRYGSTAIDWYDAPDPRPDYYRKLPSFIDNPQADAVADLLRNSEEARQIDWSAMYNANRNNFQTINDVEGISGNNVSGNRSNYIVEDRRYDSEIISFNNRFESFINDRVALSGGVGYQAYLGDNFKTVDDLLGGDFYVDIDKFAEFEPGADNTFIQNDLSRPNRVVREGDVFGYHYEMHIRKANAWLQGNVSLDRFDFFLAAALNNTTFWREGLLQNGKFPDNSIGESERLNFLDYQFKGGVTFKIDGRNYIVANGNYQVQAPFARYSFTSPRTRNQTVPGLEQVKIQGIEGGYLLKAPYASARVMGYYTTFKDQLFNRSFYLDNAIINDDGSTTGGFVNYIMTGMDTRHMGLELAADVEIISRLKLSAVAAIGEYQYTNRPTAFAYIDNRAESLPAKTVYIKNFNISGTPQKAYTFGIHYSGKDYWFANLNFNYFEDVWIDFYPERRTLAAVATVADPEFTNQVVEQGSDLWRDIIDQERAPSAFTMDFFGGKSWKINDLFVYLNVGVSNILDKQDFRTGGYEQFRFDFENKEVERFPNRYFYSYGRTYYISLAFRL